MISKGKDLQHLADGAGESHDMPCSQRLLDVADGASNVLHGGGNCAVQVDQHFAKHRLAFPTQDASLEFPVTPLSSILPVPGQD